MCLQTAADVVSTAYTNIKPKDRKYDREYAGLYRLLSQGNLAGLSAEDIGDYQELINTAGDTELPTIWE